MHHLFRFIKKWRFVILIALVFLVLRLPAIHYPYHQDEWKNVATSETIEGAGRFFAHPPLMQIAFVTAYDIFGENNFRIFPLLFSIASGILLFLIVRNRTDKKIATWVIVLFTICFYNIFGSVVPDVDGAIIPFFFLLSVYFYDLFNKSEDKNKWKWFVLLTVSILFGFLIKLNFILVIGVLIIDYIWSNWKQFTIRKIGLVSMVTIGFSLLYIISLSFFEAIYPAFSINIMLGHANQFADGLGRNWLQIIVQAVKAIFYLSPLLIIPLLFITKEIFNRTRIFFIYIILGLLFYIVLFDFSRGALDKYLMFLIVPLSIIVGMILSNIFEKIDIKNIWKTLRIPIIIGAVLSVVLILTNFLPHEVLPLYPKTLWFSRVLDGQWLMLNPFNGGSGPLGFYVSFMFIVVSFVISITLGIVALFKKQWRVAIMSILIITGMTYNIIFAEEYLFGKLNGSATRVLNESVNYIKENDSIKSVLSYNDIGNQYLSPIGKYGGRIYAIPESESGYREKFAKHVALGGHFLVVGIPPLGQESFYGKFFNKCNILFDTSSKAIVGSVYDCSNNKTLLNNI
ncbi:MAG: glycosyltransferase family 39 protein [Candidatus Paceibacterota bacterium]|jgi:4-amino-4-deoxy-L-arabinose transferase-like glycosyltransferase